MYLIISGTNRKNSNSILVAQLYADILKQENIDSQIIDLKDLPDDFAFSALYHNEGQNPVFNKITQQIDEAEKIIFIIPEYNGSFPGVLKTFIDGLKYPDSLRGKKTALVGISSGSMGAALALSHFTDILNYMDAFVLPQKPRLSIIYKAMDEGILTNNIYQELLTEQAKLLIDF